MQLGGKIDKADVLKELNNLIWNETIKKDEFESSWKTIMEKFELNGNNWFNTMYNMRHLWIPAYFKECTFSGLMRTTSRSEAENYFYGLLSNPDLHLVDFIIHFETALEAQRCIQKKNDHESRYTTPDFKTGLKIEVEAAQLFTRNVFYEIQSEMIASISSCMSIKLEETEEMSTFTIKDTDKNPKHHGQFQVIYFPKTYIIMPY